MELRQGIVTSLGLLLLMAGPSPSGAQDPKPGVDAPGPRRAETRAGKPRRGGPPGLVKPAMSDTVKARVYADNWFMLYVNGELVAVDSIKFTPHNVVSVDILPEYPMTIAVMAKDNADPATGLEYGSSIGDGGLCLKIGDEIVSGSAWKAKCFSHGPVGGDVSHPVVRDTPIPAGWWKPGFDDSSWPAAKVFKEEEVGPKPPFYEHDFKGAAFIWSDDLALDNTVLFRARIEKPGWTRRWNTKPDLDVSGAPLK